MHTHTHTRGWLFHSQHRGSEIQPHLAAMGRYGQLHLLDPGLRQPQPANPVGIKLHGIEVNPEELHHCNENLPDNSYRACRNGLCKKNLYGGTHVPDCSKIYCFPEAISVFWSQISFYIAPFFPFTLACRISILKPECCLFLFSSHPHNSSFRPLSHSPQLAFSPNITK